MPRPPQTRVIDLPFPMQGLDQSDAFHAQRKGTTPSCQNVRGYDPQTGRGRGAQRAGLSKYLASQVNSSNAIQLIDHVVATEIAEGHTITETITSTQSWTCPTGVTSVQVECWGGGGGGSGSGDAGGPALGGYGGGGGAYSIKAVSVTPGSSYTATVGAAGTAGAALVFPSVFGPGGNGGDTWFSSTGTVLAKGGQGGLADGSSHAGVGGAASSGVGDTKYSGGNGADGGAGAGGGGGSSAGTAANGNNASGTTAGSAPSGGGAGGAGAAVQAAGSAGSAPGGGGGGGLGAGSSGVNQAGGAGAVGQIRLTYTQILRLGVRGLVGVAAAGGTIKKFNSTDGLSSVTNGSAALSTTRPVIFGAQLFNRYYFADGTNYKYLDVSTDTVSSWTASSGSLPVDASSNRALLICMWRARIVLSGVRFDANNWFMSAVANAADFDYSPSDITATMAVAGNTSAAGKCGDIITCLCPYSDDTLIIGGDHSIWAMNGDPADGGRIDLITERVGMAWGRPFCKDPEGGLWFMSSTGAIYLMTVGSKPQRMSQPIENVLGAINFDTHIVRMAWDDSSQGLHVMVTPLDPTATATHWFFDVRNQAWWPDVFANKNHNPRVVHAYDGDDPDDRVILLGSNDGYIRYFNPTALSDDGKAIESFAYVGPIQDKDGIALRLTDLQATLGADSDDVVYEVFAGDGAESAFNSTEPYASGTFEAGRNPSQSLRVRGHALYVKLSNDTLGQGWSLESLRAIVGGTGRIGQRAF